MTSVGPDRIFLVHLRGLGRLKRNHNRTHIGQFEGPLSAAVKDAIETKAPAEGLNPLVMLKSPCHQRVTKVHGASGQHKLKEAPELRARIHAGTQSNYVLDTKPRTYRLEGASKCDCAKYFATTDSAWHLMPQTRRSAEACESQTRNRVSHAST